MKLIVLISLLFLVAIGASCTSSIPLEKKCVTDTDCAAASCCHATDALNKLYAPNCQNAMCTMSCEPDTLDCGQGSVKCIQEQCKVVMN